MSSRCVERQESAAALNPSRVNFKNLSGTDAAARRQVRDSLGDIYDTKVLVSSESISKLPAFQALVGTSLSEIWGALKKHELLIHPPVKLGNVRNNRACLACDRVGSVYAGAL